MTFKKIETSSEPQNRKKRELNKTVRILLVVAGTILVLLSILGIFLPVLPTTPLLILAAALYARSSKRFYGWLTNNRFLGKYIKDYQEGKGIPLKAKITAIILIWVTIGCSVFFVIEILWVRILLVIIAVGTTIFIALKKPKVKNNADISE